MSDLTYDPQENLVASDALEDAVLRLGEHKVAVSVYNAKEKDRVMMVLASFPTIPGPGDIITLPDGVVCLVQARRFDIVKKADSDGRLYYRALTYVTAKFNDLNPTQASDS